MSVYAGNDQFAPSTGALAEALRVVVTDPGTQRAKQGVEVTWRIVAGSGATLGNSTSTSNAQGIASTTLNVGAQLGTYRVEATVDNQIGPAALFTASAVAVPSITSVTPGNTNTGDTVTIAGQNFSTDADDNVVTFGGLRGRVVAASATQLRAIVPACVPTRSVAVRVALGAVAGNQTNITVNGTNGATLQLARGDVRAINDAVELACFRLPGSTSPVSYLLVPQNYSEMLNTITGIEVAGLVPGSSSMTLNDLPVAASGVQDWEWKLRRMEQDLLRGPGVALRPQASVTAAACGAATLGARCNFQVLDKDLRFTRVTAEVKAISTRAVVYQDINASPSNGMTTADFVTLASVFDDPIYPTDVATFGPVSDLDSNGRVIILLTPVVNELTDRGDAGFIAGFFYGCDLLARSSCSGSNEAEVFYALTADPNGQFSDARSRDAVMRSLPPVLAHEFQHMINFGQRSNGSIDALWLSEGMAHHAEDVVGDVFQARGDVTNADLFKRQNTTRADRYLRATASTSIIGSEDVGSLELRGGAWLLVKYLAGQYGNDILHRLTRSTSSGVTNVTTQVGKPWRTILSEWGIALWADNAPELAGVTLRPEYTFLDVNLRERLAPSGNYPLRPTTYGFQDFVHRENLVASSQTYLLVQHSTASQQLNLTLAGKFGGSFAASAAPQVSILRVR